MGSNNQPGSEDISREEPREEAPIPPALQVVHPSEQPESHPGAVRLALTGAVATRSNTAQLLSAPSRLGSGDGGSDSTRT